MIGVSSYSFGDYFEKLGAKGIMEKAKEIGFNAIEFAELGVKGDKNFLIDTAKKYKEYAEEAGIEIINFATAGDMSEFVLGGNCIEDEINRLQGMVDVAEALGVDKMRHDIAWGVKNCFDLKVFYAELPKYVMACREITKYAEQKGIKTMFENHGHFVQQTERVQCILEEVNHPNFGLLLDMGNFICADQNHFNSVKTLAKYAFHVHAKDFYIKPYNCPDEEGFVRTLGGNLRQGCALGEGQINPAKCIEIIKDMGYKGNIALEYEGRGDKIEGIRKGFTVLKENW